MKVPAMNTSLRVVCASFFVFAAAHAADWPQWRGPNRDGIVKDPAHSLDKLPSDPKVLWKIDAGPGQSSPVIAGGKVVLLDAKGSDEVAHCYDAATGKLLWEATLPAAGTATPAVYEVNGREYVVIAAGGGKSGEKSGGSYVAFALPPASGAAAGSGSHPR